MDSENYKSILKKLNVNPLCSIQSGYKDIYCVVKRSFNLKQSATGDRDWKITLYIADPTYSGVDITVLLFHKDANALSVFKDNTILILKGVTIKSYNNKMQVIVNANRRVALFQPTSDQPEEIDFLECPLDGDDHNIVRYLQKWSGNLDSNEKIPEPNLPITGRQYLEVKDIIDDNKGFMNFIGQVVHFQRKDEKHAELLLTDYTENPYSDSSFEELDNLNVGVNFLILCGLWDDNAENCPELKPSDYVSLTNCRKKCKDFLELNIHGDLEKKQRVIKLEANDPRLEQLMIRQMNHPGQEVKKKKRKIEDFQPYGLESTLLTEVGKTSRIKTILDERETDKYYKILAYIKDYRPRNIKDWIQGWCSSCNKSCPPDQLCIQCQQPTKPIYKFALLVNDDSGAELTLYGFGYEALKLFPTAIPEDAYKDDDVFNNLKKIIDLACNEDRQHFDIALKPYLVPGQNYFNYQIVETQFTLNT